MRRRKVSEGSVQPDADEAKLSAEEQAIARRMRLAAGRAKAERKKHTVDATKEQLVIVEEAMRSGHGENGIYRALVAAAEDRKKPDLRCSINRVRTLKARVQEQWKLEAERDRPTSKVSQIQRLYRKLQMAEHGVKRRDGTYVHPPDLRLAVSIEQEIAKLQGNYEPLQIDVDLVHREAIVNVISGLTDEMATQLVNGFDRMMQLAQEKAKERGEELPQLLPALEEQGQAFTVEARKH